MDIQNISVHIRYSKPLADGSHKTVELGAEGTLAPGENWHEAELSLYNELGQAMKHAFASNGSSRAAQAGSGQAPAKKAPASRPIHWCEEHNCDFRRYEKNGRVWYSHKNGDGWCREQPAVKGVA
jgi:hypothetical protein